MGHLISGRSIYPLPEKLQTIKSLPVPKTPKEKRQMLGLPGYYHKVMYIFSDLQHN